MHNWYITGCTVDHSICSMCFQWWVLKKHQKKHRTMFQVSANSIKWEVIRHFCPDCTLIYILFLYSPVSEDVERSEAVGRSGTAICWFLDGYGSNMYFFGYFLSKINGSVHEGMWLHSKALEAIKLLCIKQSEALQTIIYNNWPFLLNCFQRWLKSQKKMMRLLQVSLNLCVNQYQLTSSKTNLPITFLHGHKWIGVNCSRCSHQLASILIF